MNRSPTATDALHARLTLGYWLASVAFYTWVPFLFVSLAQPRGLGLAWDLGMLAGLSALSGFAVLPLLTARSWARPSVARWIPRLIQRLHNDLAWWLCAALFLHVAASLVLEPLTLEYLTWRGSAPMLAGLIAAAVAVPLFVLSLATVRRRMRSPGAWRVSHTLLSVGLMVGAVWHVIGTGYYVRGAGPALGLLWLCGFPLLLVGLWRIRNRIPARPTALAGHRQPERAQARALFRRARLALLFIWLLALVFAGVSSRWVSPLADRSPCAAEPCL